MTTAPFSSRLLALLQRARRAVRMYGLLGRPAGHAEQGNEERDAQAREWRVTNELLISRITALVGVRPVTAITPRELSGVVHQFDREAIELSTLLAEGNTRLIGFAEAADYIAAARMARELVILHARSQAIAAVIHELSVLLSPHGSRGTSAELGGAGPVAAPQKISHPSNDTQQSVSDEHRFVVQRVKATLAGRGASLDAGERGERKSEDNADNVTDESSPQRLRKVLPLRPVLDALK